MLKERTKQTDICRVASEGKTYLFAIREKVVGRRCGNSEVLRRPVVQIDDAEENIPAFKSRSWDDCLTSLRESYRYHRHANNKVGFYEFLDKTINYLDDHYFYDFERDEWIIKGAPNELVVDRRSLYELANLHWLVPIDMDIHNRIEKFIKRLAW